MDALRVHENKSIDDLWGIIKPYLLSQRAKTGRPKADLRKSFRP